MRRFGLRSWTCCTFFASRCSLHRCRRPLESGQHPVLEAKVRASILSAAQELIKRRAVDIVIRKLRTEAAAMQQ